MTAPPDPAIQAGARVLAGDGPATADHHWQALAVWRAMQAHMPAIVPPGWQAVPVEATERMMLAAVDEWHRAERLLDDQTRGVWAEMLAAAPKPGDVP